MLQRMLRAALVAGAALYGVSGLAHEHKPPFHGREPAVSPAVKPAPIQVKLLDLDLTNQQGETARFKSGVIGERIVVVDNIYTSCTTICPIVTTIMVNVHNKIGVRADKEVSLISLSVDPVTDTPQRLKAYASRHKAGWNMWTGTKPAMEQVLKGLGVYTPDPTDHPSSILVGDGRTGEWTRFYGFANPEQIVKRVDELLAARQNTALKTGAGR